MYVYHVQNRQKIWKVCERFCIHALTTVCLYLNACVKKVVNLYLRQFVNIPMHVWKRLLIYTYDCLSISQCMYMWESVKKVVHPYTYDYLSICQCMCGKVVCIRAAMTVL